MENKVSHVEHHLKLITDRCAAVNNIQAPDPTHKLLSQTDIQKIFYCHTTDLTGLTLASAPISAVRV